jgi:hypothetical protein
MSIGHLLLVASLAAGVALVVWATRIGAGGER